MFKKKNELPPWPKPPTNKQMLEDITSAPIDDPVFSEFAKRTQNTPNESNVDATYDQIRQFLNVNEKLDKSMAKLSTQNDAIQVTNMELKKMADDIRQQAVNALK